MRTLSTQLEIGTLLVQDMNSLIIQYFLKYNSDFAQTNFRNIYIFIIVFSFV